MCSPASLLSDTAPEYFSGSACWESGEPFQAKEQIKRTVLSSHYGEIGGQVYRPSRHGYSPIVFQVR